MFDWGSRGLQARFFSHEVFQFFPCPFANAGAYAHVPFCFCRSYFASPVLIINCAISILTLPNLLAWMQCAIILGGAFVFDLIECIRVTLLLWIQRILWRESIG